jgi:hypothetical protein
VRGWKLVGTPHGAREWYSVEWSGISNVAGDREELNVIVLSKVLIAGGLQELDRTVEEQMRVLVEAGDYRDSARY